MLYCLHPIDRLDEAKAFFTIKRLSSFLLDYSLDIIDTSNIWNSFLGMHGLNLNWFERACGAGKVALSITKRINK